ncbi:hypothetical protein A2926_04475 [Candidatus Giovannonibacteria bacterium RIFCSPLOWO2_01_FULL_44_40]|uniref:Type 4a pilus biogenesis protein PilO n=1 Tax=Candidatus Giovannonibacteria bacterium RIFCSPHIGHO2_01_FULL_45_23 TaxID=1798325 RepID=A0A1F5VJ61_9BACT|nr:MAG: hypothetical protein A2834_02920 [Candidatus Giovannonibacteria bacterium RIFCSPHIGHO2_01_FULL_45_23]OGF75683.1 MAG: hypothetical protein A3C77_01845 [Candidatus Giovannonibacteria bacterium RIFCSPHIGHO2_02_FULL_45_13]OGF80091.1 MAG: hypothetical protein A2926_04475 [Candidatus Giovannonibacteria bacterium RIFCSPLOWO2_01_FULL_44_40]
MDILSNKKPVLMLGLMILILAALIVFTWFLYQKIKEASAVVAEAEGKIALLEKKGREFSLAESGIRDYEKEIEFLEGAFLNESRFVDFLRLLESMSREANVNFSAKSARVPLLSDQGKSASQTQEAVLSFELTGNFGAVANFIAMLDNIPYAGLIESLNIVPQAEPGQKSTGKLLAKINYIIFNFDL